MNIGIGAIFRDEYEYIIEWLAWHEIAGFNKFYIADNASSDGSLSLLEALEQAEHIEIIHQPITKTAAQIKAYERITQKALNEIDAILFIDADEFICHESFQDGDEARHLKLILNRHDVGAVGITWRVFGSSGHELQDDRLVVERFTKYASNNKPQSRLIKSASKIGFIKNISAHYVQLHDSLIYVDPSGKKIDDFIRYDNKKLESASVSGLRKAACTSPLMINHYVIKSRQEFIEKKRKRGDAMLGVSHERSMQFFENHDDNDREFNIPKTKISNLKNHINAIVNDIATQTPFFRSLRGYIDTSTENKIAGWLVDTKGSSEGLKVNIFLNGTYQGSAHVGFFRPDLQEKGVSLNGKSGFQWTHPSPLKKGDVVEVRVNANKFMFGERQKIEI